MKELINMAATPRMTMKRMDYLIGIGISILAFIVYVATLCPGVDVIDAGELGTVPYILGIAHPTGYPVFTWVGWMFSHVLVPFRIIYRLNLMAAFFCAAGLFFYFQFILFFLRRFELKKNKGGGKDGGDALSAGKNGTDLRIFISAGCATVILAFCSVYWAQALSIEVYSLHVFFLSIHLTLFTRALSVDAESLKDPRRNVYWYLFAYLLGIAFCNHMTTILLAPAFLFFYFYIYRFNEESWKRLLHLVPLFLLGLSAYLYLYLRAPEHPILNWGNTYSLERLFWHFSGKQYQVWLFSSTESAAKQLNFFINTLPGVFAYVPLLLAVVGIAKLAKERMMVLVFTLLLFFGCLLYSINYDIHDIDSYFLLAYFAIAMWAGVGVWKLLEVAAKSNLGRYAAIGLVMISFLPLALNYSTVDESDFRMVEEYSQDVLKSVEPNAIILTYQWDYFVAAMYYLQIVEHVRPDVIVIDKELMRRSWYYVQMEARYPWLVEQNKREIDAFQLELDKFEHDLPYNPQVIEGRYAALIRSILIKNYPTRPIYATQEIEPEYLSAFKMVPSGLTFRLYADTLTHPPLPVPTYGFHIPTRNDQYTDGMLNLYARSYVNHAIYVNLFNKPDSALALVDAALKLVPNQREALLFKEQLTAGKR
jgi:hypothetical protein